MVNAHAAAKAEKELADELARVRDRWRSGRCRWRGDPGTSGTRYQPLIERLQRMGTPLAWRTSVA